ncbi:ParB-like nuclease domain protein [Gordonia phage Ecliptus]|nr:ParB-like nuclease domain protein [Gordonia phage Ecliptus]
MTTPVMFQALPPLSPEEYSELERSILDNGVMVPIVLDENGVVIDGHHRQQIAAHHDLPCPSETKCGFSDTEKRGLALSLNLHRRQLTREQKRALVAESIKADPQLSDREHGRRTGVSKNTASAVRDQLEESGQVDHFSERLDPRTGNASQPATKPRPAAPQALSGEPDSDAAVEARPPITEYITAGELAELNVATSVSTDPTTTDTRRRKPLEDQFFHATDRLNGAVASLKKLGADDRLPRNKEKVARYRNDLLQAIDALQRVAEQLA